MCVCACTHVKSCVRVKLSKIRVMSLYVYVCVTIHWGSMCEDCFTLHPLHTSLSTILHMTMSLLASGITLHIITDKTLIARRLSYCRVYIMMLFVLLFLAILKPSASMQRCSIRTLPTKYSGSIGHRSSNIVLYDTNSITSIDDELSSPTSSASPASSGAAYKGKSTVSTVLKDLFLMILPIGLGQESSSRTSKLENNERRKVNHVFMWTHVFLVMATIVSYMNQVYDLFGILFIVTPLSFVYHYMYERPGIVAKVEGFFAKLLWIYGALQIVAAPSATLIGIELVFCTLTLCTFFITNFKKQYYDPYHSLMHVIPSIWCIIVALTHQPLVDISAILSFLLLI